jgi:hypothetical protein
MMFPFREAGVVVRVWCDVVICPKVDELAGVEVVKQWHVAA